MITFVDIVLLGKFSKDVLTALITSELGILGYKDLTSRDTKYELPGIFFLFCWFFVRSHLDLVYKMVFDELLAEGDNLHTYIDIWCETVKGTDYWYSRITLCILGWI